MRAARPGRARGGVRSWFRGLKQLVPSAEERARAATRRARARGKATAHIFPVDVPSAVDQPLELRGLTVKCGIEQVGHLRAPIEKHLFGWYSRVPRSTGRHALGIALAFALSSNLNRLGSWKVSHYALATASS